MLSNDLEVKRRTACAILETIKDSMKLPEPLEGYVNSLSEESLDQIITSASKVMIKNMPELIYHLGYDVYNEDTKLRHIGVMVRASNGRGAIIQLVQDRKSSAIYKTTFHRASTFSKTTNSEVVSNWVDDFKDEHAKWNALGSIATPTEIALRPTSRLGESGSYVYSQADSRFTPFMKDKGITAATLQSWFGLLDLSGDKESESTERMLFDFLCFNEDLDGEPEPHYEAWGTW